MSVTVLLDAVDISALLLPSVTVTREERSAALAVFVYRPNTAPLLPAELVRQSVEIYWDAEVIFTGQVNRAYWDLKAHTFRVECSDFLQEHFEGLTNSTIMTLIPGSSYSSAVFGEREDGWQFALDLMQTTRLDVHLDRTGALVTPSWAAETVADINLADGDILNAGAYTLELARARDITTRMTLAYEYRYSKWKIRTHNFGWAYTNKGTPDGADDWCDWAQNLGFTMPTREIILSGANGTGWALSGGINYTTHPETGIYCGGIINWVNTDEAQSQVAIAAAWAGTRHWAQTTTEAYAITIVVPAREVTYGIVPHEDSISYQVEADDASFEANPRVLDSYVVDPIGDLVGAQGDEASRINDLTVLMEKAISTLWEAYRQNTVTVETAIFPTIELAHTVNITTDDIIAQGKIKKIEHTIDNNKATTKVTLTIMTGGAGSVSDPIVVPPPPDTDPTYPAPSASTTVSTYVGGCANVPVYDPDWRGWTTNMDPFTCSGGAPAPDQIYPLRFSIKGPDIESEARDAVGGTADVSYDIIVPEDQLVLL